MTYLSQNVSIIFANILVILEQFGTKSYTSRLDIAQYLREL